MISLYREAIIKAEQKGLQWKQAAKDSRRDGTPRSSFFFIFLQDIIITMEYDHSTFISPLTWRYGSDEMKHIFSEEHKRKLLRRVWIALARAESKAGLVTEEQVMELEAHKDDIDIARASEIESEIHHDLMAEIRTYAEQCPIAGGIIHLGATSMDALDNADAVRFKEALSLTLDRLDTLITVLADKAEQYRNVPTMAFTHIQPAEITTIGYRIAQTLQDLLDDRDEAVSVLSSIKGKGMKGAVGTAASSDIPNPRDVRAGNRGFSCSNPDIFKEAGSQDHRRALLNRGDTAQILTRPAHTAVSIDWRILRTIRQETGRLIGNAIQAQSDKLRENLLAFKNCRKPVSGCVDECIHVHSRKDP